MNEAKTKKIITAVVILGIIIFASTSWGGSEVEKFSSNDYASKAEIISKEFVSKELKSPGSADFPGDCINTFYLNDSAYMVKACVDAQNEFGAKIRNFYECKLKYKGGDWADSNNWELQHLNMFSQP